VGESLHEIGRAFGKDHGWQRGTNENTNGLLRQYFPRKTDLSGYSQADLDKVALRLNQRPRKTLGFETPASKLQASVASTG
jgi:IS30 family transposase